MIKLIAAATIAGLLSAGAASAGTLLFNLQGTNPDGKSGYRGTVALTEVSEGAHGEKAGIVTWTVGRAAPISGIVQSNRENPGRLSISFPGKPVPGVALGQFSENGDIHVIWYVGGEAAGSETWTRKR